MIPTTRAPSLLRAWGYRSDSESRLFYYSITKLTLFRRKVKHLVKNTATWTATQKSKLLEARTRLYRELAKFRRLQAIYMPAALISIHDPIDDAGSTPTAVTASSRSKRKRDQGDDNEPTKVNPIELRSLFLPSELSADIRARCHPRLGEIEKQMRDAQCRTSLDYVRSHLHIQSGLWTYKQRHSRHQGATTRSLEDLAVNNRKIAVFQDKYNTAREAIIALDSTLDPDQLQWKKLNNNDLRCLQDPELTAKRIEKEKKRKEKKRRNLEDTVVERADHPVLGEGARRISWIWEGAGIDADPSSMEPGACGLHEGESCFTFFSILTTPLITLLSDSGPVGQLQSSLASVERGGQAPEGGDAACVGYLRV